MRKIDTRAYSAQSSETHIKPEKVNLGELPPIRPSAKPAYQDNSTDVVQQVREMEEGQTRYETDILDSVRREVSKTGSIPSLYRLNRSEKSRLAQLTFQLKSEGYKVSDTDIVRIALNYVLEDEEATATGGIVRRIIQRLKR